MIQFSQVGLMLSKDLMLFEELKGHTFFFSSKFKKKNLSLLFCFITLFQSSIGYVQNISTQKFLLKFKELKDHIFFTLNFNGSFFEKQVSFFCLFAFLDYFPSVCYLF